MPRNMANPMKAIARATTIIKSNIDPPFNHKRGFESTGVLRIDDLEQAARWIRGDMVETSISITPQDILTCVEKKEQ
jgi:hypothetical protein